MAKQKSWEDFCNYINNTIPSKKVWSKINQIQGKSTKSVNILKGNIIIKTNQYKANSLAKTFANNSSDNNFSNNFKINKKQNIKNCKIPLDDKFSNKETSFNEHFNLNEFNNVFIKRKGTATDPDKFSYLLFKNLPETFY